jgi:Kdo2-lipid IVA lauroyltransferase/acyltransferase
MNNINNLFRRNKRYHENFWRKLFNNTITGLLTLISLLPFRVIYIISDFLCFFIQHIFKYRRKVILNNLHHAFPEKPEKEIKQLVRKFYCHFTDLMLETVKLHSISEKQMNKHITFKGLDLIENYYQQGKSIIILAMHHNNWEWCSFVQTKGKHLGLMLYNPVRGNQPMEKFLLHSREKWGGKCIPVHQSARVAMEFHRKKIPTGLWLGADQTPQKTSKFWTVFLNREAPFFSGPEKIAAKTNQPVFFQHVRKVGRGRYEANFTLLFKNPAEVEPKKILLGYIRKMEEIIHEEPEYYLWSHRRWKHQRPEGVPLTL